MYIIVYGFKKRVNKKSILSLRLPSKCSFTLSKLRFFGLRKPKTTSFYSLSFFLLVVLYSIFFLTFVANFRTINDL